jgi:hypothetical protein
MYEPLNDPAAIDAVNQFFNDLIAVADFEARLPLLRPQVEDFRFEALTHAGMLSTQNQLRGFLWGVTVAGTLTPEQGHDFSQRLDTGRQAGWL